VTDVLFQEYFSLKNNPAATVVLNIFYWDCSFYCWRHRNIKTKQMKEAGYLFFISFIDS